MRSLPLRATRVCIALAASAAFLLAGALAADGSAGAVSIPDRGVEPVPDLNPEPPKLAYLTETASATPKVWVAAANGSDPKLLGPGQQPLLSPNGASVAVSLFGIAPGAEEHGPAIGIYPVSGAPIADYLSLETATATPLAWSPDSRYLAVELQSNGATDVRVESGLGVIDTQTGIVTQIASGTIYGASFARDGSDTLVFGLSHSESFAGGVNLYMSEASGAGLRKLTSDGRSLNPLWGPTYIAYDRERHRHLSPEYQIWLASQSGTPVRKLTHVRVGALLQGLVPLAFSADGSRMLAQFEGEDTIEAYAVSVASGHARRVATHGRSAIAAAISADGSTLLVDEGSFEEPASHGRIAAVPFAGGPPKVLVAHGAEASWND
ncbi:MAG TPA: hypothetical protein VK790_03760 [Solirubrobacteraceae bacterium]|nr:hypothetical protein [Solirubrobacteraceae bacterium]